jgi:hypothetical protein
MIQLLTGQPESWMVDAEVVLVLSQFTGELEQIDRVVGDALVFLLYQKGRDSRILRRRMPFASHSSSRTLPRH